MITIELKGIDSGENFSPLAFPSNKMELKNGTTLKALADFPWLGIEINKKFQIAWGGEYVRAGGLTWSVQQLIEEIEYGHWLIKE